MEDQELRIVTSTIWKVLLRENLEPGDEQFLQDGLDEEEIRCRAQLEELDVMQKLRNKLAYFAPNGMLEYFASQEAGEALDVINGTTILRTKHPRQAVLSLFYQMREGLQDVPAEDSSSLVEEWLLIIEDFLGQLSALEEPPTDPMIGIAILLSEDLSEIENIAVGDSLEAAFSELAGNTQVEFSPVEEEVARRVFSFKLVLETGRWEPQLLQNRTVALKPQEPTPLE